MLNNSNSATSPISVFPLKIRMTLQRYAAFKMYVNHLFITNLHIFFNSKMTLEFPGVRCEKTGCPVNTP